MKKISGIYKIINTSNGKYYMGQSNDCKDRWRRHRGDLGNNKHANPHLQNAWNKYGKDAFRFEILDTCEPSQLDSLELFYLSFLALDKDRMYNICDSPGSGPQAYGANNHKFDPTFYTFVNIHTKEVFRGTQYDFKRKYNISDKYACIILHPKFTRSIWQGWVIESEYRKRCLKKDLRLLVKVIEDERNRIMKQEREVEREARAQYAIEHADEIRAQQNKRAMAYYHSHKESRQDYAKQWYGTLSPEHKKVRQQRTMEWKRRNKDKVRVYNIKYREAHPHPPNK